MLLIDDAVVGRLFGRSVSKGRCNQGGASCCGPADHTPPAGMKPRDSINPQIARHPTHVNVEETIDTVLSVYERRIEAKGVYIKRRYHSDGATIKTYPGEIRQVFTTLLLNAIEARRFRGSYHCPRAQSIALAESLCSRCPSDFRRQRSRHSCIPHFSHLRTILYT